MFNRFTSNFLVLLVLGAGFLGVLTALNWLALSDESADHEFSFERRSADRHYRDNNFAAAARYYGQLAQSDLNNGGARFSQALSLAQLREPHLNVIRKQLRLTEPDQSVIDQATLEANRLSADAIEAYEVLLDFPEFRNFSRFQLAKMLSFAGESDRAIGLLKQALDEKFKHRYRIQDYLEFQPILNHPEFQKLIQPEFQKLIQPR